VVRWSISWKLERFNFRESLRAQALVGQGRATGRESRKAVRRPIRRQWRSCWWFIEGRVGGMCTTCGIVVHERAQHGRVVRETTDGHRMGSLVPVKQSHGDTLAVLHLLSPRLAPRREPGKRARLPSTRGAWRTGGPHQEARARRGLPVRHRRARESLSEAMVAHGGVCGGAGHVCEGRRTA
jgi:hypothetical protein